MSATKKRRPKAAAPTGKKPIKTTTKPVKQKPRRPRAAPRGAALKAHALEILKRLRAEYPDAHCELDYRNPYELAVATVLSAQCTDKRVNIVTPELFRRWPDAASLAEAPIGEIEDVIRSTGFFRSKAKSLSGLAKALLERHSGVLPESMDELVVLPGIGRKTANVVLGNAFGINEGIVVDTHVARVSARLGLTRDTDAVKIERALVPLFPRDSWTLLSHLLIWHGRRICVARKPRCADCILNDICPSAFTF